MEKFTASCTGHRSVCTRNINRIKEKITDSEVSLPTLQKLFENVEKQRENIGLLDQGYPWLDQEIATHATAEIEKEIIDTEDFNLNLDIEITERSDIPVKMNVNNNATTTNTSAELTNSSSTFESSTLTTDGSDHVHRRDNTTRSENILSTPGSDHVHMRNNSTRSNHKLPKLTMPTFAGDILQWQTFWDSFESAVHDNSSLSDVEKFNYLK